jgi:hypothetical protein
MRDMPVQFAVSPAVVRRIFVFKVAPHQGAHFI